MRTYSLPVENNLSGQSTQYSITLDKVDYILALYYNQRIDTWFLTISTADGAITVEQMPLLLGINPMVGTFAYSELLPFGDIQVNDDPEDNIDPTLVTLGDGKSLIYASILDA